MILRISAVMTIASLFHMLGLATDAHAQTSCAQIDVAITGVTPAPADPAALAGDCATLLGLMDALRGTASLNWANSLSMTAWHGITVTGSRVSRLVLQDRSLTGTLPAALGDLTSLQRLWLDRNQLSAGGTGMRVRLSGPAPTCCTPQPRAGSWSA